MESEIIVDLSISSFSILSLESKGPKLTQL